MAGQSTDALISTAHAHLRKGQFDQAAKVLEEVLNLEPNHALAHANLGEIAALQRQYTVAETHLRAALLGDPNLYTAANHLGMVYLQTNRPAQALEILLS